MCIASVMSFRFSDIFGKCAGLTYFHSIPDLNWGFFCEALHFDLLSYTDLSFYTLFFVCLY